MLTLKKKVSKIKFVAYVASSIDGRISKTGLSAVDWTSAEDWKTFQKFLSTVDAVVVGHNTFRVSESRLKWRNAIVITSKVDKPVIKGKTLFFNPEKSNLRKFLESKDYETIAVIGGGQVYDYCLEHNMLDEFFVTIEPYVFTEGVPMFSGRKFKKYKFVLQSVKKLNKKGTLLLQYKNANKSNQN